MRKRTQKEKEIIGKVEVILRELNIKKNTRGYVPLLDIIVYAYAFPEEGLLDIVAKLAKENYYVGVADEMLEETKEMRINYQSTTNQYNPNAKMLVPAMVRTIETAIERADNQYLERLGLGKLRLILEESELEKIEPKLLSEIGEEKYGKYTHNERVLFCFVKKILKSL